MANPADVSKLRQSLTLFYFIAKHYGYKEDWYLYKAVLIELSNHDQQLYCAFAQKMT